jgi:hypothetical protein
MCGKRYALDKLGGLNTKLMSRSHGRIQRAILDALETSPEWKFSALDLAAIAYGLPADPAGNVAVSEAQQAAVRHALSSLRRQKKAFQIGRFFEGRERRIAGAMWASEQKARARATKVVQTVGPQYLEKDLLDLLGWKPAQP